LTQTILLYGATGYSGRLIAAHSAAAWKSRGQYQLVLAGRNGAELAALANKHGVDFRVFGLDRRRDVVANLREVDVLINAAGPFALTADRLAKGALAQPKPCHYVDINGEVDVYKRLDDYALSAQRRSVAIVCGAGYTAAGSNILLHAALAGLKARAPEIKIGAIRIALSRIASVSRGSATTLLRSVREQVTVARATERAEAGVMASYATALDYVAAGMLERTFDFRVDDAPGAQPDRRIASAANMVDTLTARTTALGMRIPVHDITSFIETSRTGRLVFTASTLLAPLFAIPAFRAAANLQIGMLPEGPTKDERDAEPHIVSLEIEDTFSAPLVEWRMQTPNAYDFTAIVSTAVAQDLADPSSRSATGWVTPGEILSGEAKSVAELRRLPVLSRCKLWGKDIPVAQKAES
jgi:short subunit dehydrogenase-like uncharacterized protein